MLKVLIIEDEALAASRLKRMLLKIDPEIEILETIDTVVDSIKWLSTHNADLIFMDIHLADGNSFSIFEKTEVKTPIIFATAYDQYAIRAFKHNSVDYLLKPIDKEDLAHSLTKFKENQAASTPLNIQSIMEAMKESKPEFQERFVVTSGEKIKSIKIEDVAYFFGQQKYVFLVTHENRKHIIDYTLGKLEGLLEPGKFFRINRQFIINFDAIKNMFSYSKSRIKIELNPPGEIDAIVSIDRAKSFKNWLNR